LRALFDAMKAETIPLGATLISQERELNDGFANHTITATSLSIGTTQAALRAAHLKYHLSTADVLTPEQGARYNELRGYNQGEPPAHGQHQKHQ
jgi:Spy/CpxP family protein refolding chaperone